MISYVWQMIPNKPKPVRRRVRRDAYHSRLFFREYDIAGRCIGQGECNDSDLPVSVLRTVDTSGDYVEWSLST